MKRSLAILLSAAALGMPTLGQGQEAAGRVLVSVGEVTITRGAQKIPAATGAEVRVGDTLDLGSQSNAQVRFTDEAIVALRSNTSFRVSEYSFQDKEPAAQRAFFNLIKGGMRTITGLIGRNNRQSYSVQTTVATIGIRGTGFALCHDCANPDGSIANGTLGAVTEGSIGVVNKSGETQFGVDQYFQVVSAVAPPQALLAPPPALRDTLEGRARAKEQQQAAAQKPAAQGEQGQAQQQQAQEPAAQGEEGQAQQQQAQKPAAQGEQGSPQQQQAQKPAPQGEQGQAPQQQAQKPSAQGELAQAQQQQAQNLSAPAAGQQQSDPIAGDPRAGGPSDTARGPSADNRITAQVASVNTPPALNTNVFQATNQAATSSEGFSEVVQPSFSGTVFYRLTGPFNIPVSCNVGPACAPAINGDITIAVNSALQRATVSAALEFSDGGIVNVSVPTAIDGIPIRITGNRVTFSQTLRLADFPENRGAFRCSSCGPNDTPGFFDEIKFSGEITPGRASVTLSGQDAFQTGTLETTVPPASPPNNSVAATTIPRVDAGTDARSQAFWNVDVDSSGRLLRFGPSVGGPAAAVGSASNTIVGSDAGAGNLVWGRWTGPGALVTDSNYDTFPTPSTGRLSAQAWITGDSPNALPPSLGTVTYTPVGSALTSTSQVLNSASLTANFVNRTLSLSIDATNNSVGGINRFVMSGSAGFNPASSRFSSGFSSVTCSGPCNSGASVATAPDGSFGGFIAGSQAQGAGVAFTAGFGANAHPTTGNGVSGAIGFKRQ